MLDFKKFFSSIADAGQRLIGKKSLRKDLTSALQLCNDLISFKGVASGIAIAREITEIYSLFDTDQKLSFFKEINKQFSPNNNEVEKKIAQYLEEKNEQSLNALGSAVEGNRQKLIRRLNMAPNGTPFLVSMREDLIKFLPINPELKNLDEDIRHLFKSWFNPGFLRLEKITWETKAAILEKIINIKRCFLSNFDEHLSTTCIKSYFSEKKGACGCSEQGPTIIFIFYPKFDDSRSKFDDLWSNLMMFVKTSDLL